MADKKEKLSKKELDTIAFRDSVTRRLKKLDETDSATRKKEKKALREANRQRRRAKRRITLQGLKKFKTFSK
tara:strand:+ start:3789 stop:4004 length:216 start_codon:yes stop_codon:yes gene_type:complete